MNESNSTYGGDTQRVRIKHWSTAIILATRVREERNSEGDIGIVKPLYIQEGAVMNVTVYNSNSREPTAIPVQG